MLLRLTLGIVYLGTDLLLGDWTLRTETMYEASSQPLPLVWYVMAGAVVLFGCAILATFIRPKLGIRAGLLACLLTASFCSIAWTRSGWHFTFNNTYGELSKTGTTAMVAIALVVSLIALRRIDGPRTHQSS